MKGSSIEPTFFHAETTVLAKYPAPSATILFVESTFASRTFLAHAIASDVASVPFFEDRESKAVSSSANIFNNGELYEITISAANVNNINLVSNNHKIRSSHAIDYPFINYI